MTSNLSKVHVTCDSIEHHRSCRVAISVHRAVLRFEEIPTFEASVQKTALA